MTRRGDLRCIAAVLLCLGTACRNGGGPDRAPDRSAAPSVSTAEAAPGTRPSPPPGGDSDTAPPEVLFTGEPTEAQRDAPNAGSAAPEATEALDTTPRRYIVAVMGDSLTDYKSHGGKFIRYLEERCPESRFDNFGKGADMVNQMRRRFRAQILGPTSPDYTHVVVFGGVNDLYSDQTAHRTNGKIQRDLSEMYGWAREAGARVVAINVAPWGGFKRYFNERRGRNTIALNAWIAEQRGQLVDFVVDAHSLLRCGDPHALCPEYAKPYKDGIHFGPLGHEVMGKALKEEVFPHCL